ncbi:MAG TPA: ABC transporter permease [Opitutaceae bacterium]|nr:ABC transporter permease [Opitutaceae bacterium]
MIADLRFTIRQLRRSPGFTAVVVLSLALGIGANATVMCWLRGFVLHPLPGVEDQGRIAVLVSNAGAGCASLPDLRDFGRFSQVFAGTEASMSTPACLTVDRQPQWIQAEIVSANFFGLLGVRPILGRTFLPDEDSKPGGNPVLVISERLWRAKFGAAPSIIGRTVDLNRHSFTVVGVAPGAFHGSSSPMETDAWAPLSMIWEVRNQGTYFLSARGARGWFDLARLQPGVTIAQAQAAVATMDAQHAKSYPRSDLGVHHRVVPLSKCPWGGQTVMGPTLQLLLAVSLGVQLIVAANVGNLLLSRAVRRQKEIAIRQAAGASRWQLARLSMMESMLLVLMGAGAGILLAARASSAVAVMMPRELAANLRLEFPLDGASLSFALLLCLATGLFFCLLPNLHASRMNLQAVLKEGGRSSQGGSAHRHLQNALVTAEVATALVLLVGAGLCVKGLRQARQVDFGFSPDHVLIGGMRIGMNGYTEDTGRVFYRRLLEHVESRPGVESAALASWFPLGLQGCKGYDVVVDGYQRPPGEDTDYNFAIISPGYFSTLRIPIVAGRGFSDSDSASAPRVAIVNEAFAKRFWPGRDPVGRRFRTEGAERTVVGVVKTGKYNQLNEAPLCFFYLPYLQGVPDLDLSVCVRTRADPSAFAGSLTHAVHEVDPGVELSQTIPLSIYSGMVLVPQRMASSLLLLLGAVALVLAAMGVYAVLGYSVSQRMQEFGVRIALGASAHDILGLVLGRGMLPAAAGVAVGLGCSLAVTRLMSRFLYGVSPFDPATFVGVPALLGAVALLACYAPARRATRVDPVVALRSD